MLIRRETLTLFRAVALLLCATAIWGGNFVVGRSMADSLPPIAFSFWRWLLAFIVLLPFAWHHFRRDWPVLRAGWYWVVVFGVLSIAVFHPLVYWGLHTTTAINGSMIQTMTPMLIVLCGYLLFGERVRVMQVVALLLSVTGMLVVITQADPMVLYTLRFVPGDLIMVAASLSWSIFSAILRKRPTVHPLSLLLAMIAVGMMAMVPMYALEYASGARMVLTTNSLWAFLYVGILASLVSYLCWNAGVAAVGANTAGMLYFVFPLFGITFSMLFLGERLQVYHMVGALLVVAGIVVFICYRPRLVVTGQ